LFGAESDLEVCSFENVCDVCAFSAYVCEIGPFLDGVGGCGFVGVGGLCLRVLIIFSISVVVIVLF